MTAIIITVVFGLIVGLIISSNVNRSKKAKRWLMKLSKVAVIICAIYLVWAIDLAQRPHGYFSPSMIVAATHAVCVFSASFFGSVAVVILFTGRRWKDDD